MYATYQEAFNVGLKFYAEDDFSLLWDIIKEHGGYTPVSLVW